MTTGWPGQPLVTAAGAVPGCCAGRRRGDYINPGKLYAKQSYGTEKPHKASLSAVSVLEAGHFDETGHYRTIARHCHESHLDPICVLSDFMGVVRPTVP